MVKASRYRFAVLALVAAGLAVAGFVAQARQDPDRAANAISKQTPLMTEALAAQGLALGSPIFIRIFKQESELELFVESSDGKFRLFRTYPICAWSGDLGPKLQEGDRQSPEGFYFVPPGHMHPQSQFHLSFNLGFPNVYDQAHRRSGSFLMVHGSCYSIGCYAMTDPAMEEIWTLAMAAFDGGQPSFEVHIFPFRMTDENMAAHADSVWTGFWANLKTGHDLFEATGIPPNATVRNRRYVFD